MFALRGVGCVNIWGFPGVDLGAEGVFVYKNKGNEGFVIKNLRGFLNTLAFNSNVIQATQIQQNSNSKMEMEHSTTGCSICGTLRKGIFLEIQMISNNSKSKK